MSNRYLFHIRHSIASFWSLPQQRRSAPQGHASVLARLFGRMHARADFNHPTSVLAQPRAVFFWGVLRCPAHTVCI